MSRRRCSPNRPCVRPRANWWKQSLGVDYFNQNRLHPYVQAWIDQGITDGGVRPTESKLIALSEFMYDLDDIGLGPTGSRMKTGNIMHMGSKIFSVLNIKSLGTYKFIESGTVTFSEDNGCKSASSSYFNQPFKSNEYSGIETDLTAINYVSESSTDTTVMSIHGMSGTATPVFFTVIPKTGANGLVYHFHASGMSFSNANHKGLYVITHTGTNTVIYKDGTKTSNPIATAAPTISTNRFVLGRNVATTNGGATLTQPYDKFVAIDFLYDRFSDSDESGFRAAFNTYKTAVGLP